MIIFKYSKLLGAEYISHLDTLRHIGKTLKRAKIEVEYSKGFNPHMEIYLSPPIFVGLKTTSEFCLIDADIDAQTFKEKFNRFSPKGIKCIEAFSVSKKYKIASLINSAEYEITGICDFDLDKILSLSEILITVKDKEKDIRPKILKLEKKTDNVLIAQLSFGNDVLRADVFCDYIVKQFGGKVTDVTKTKAFIDGKPAEEWINENDNKKTLPM